eukprot:3938400-Rhodomonas_salina.1
MLYMKRARALGVRFTRHDGKRHGINTLSTYVDSSDADCRITRRSTGWFVCFFNSAPASFRGHAHPRDVRVSGLQARSHTDLRGQSSHDQDRRIAREFEEQD